MRSIRQFMWIPATIIVVSGLAGAAAGCSGSGSASSGGGASGGGNAVVQASPAGGVGKGLDALVPGTAEPFSASQDAGRTAAVGGKLVSDPLRALPALRSAVIRPLMSVCGSTTGTSARRGGNQEGRRRPGGLRDQKLNQRIEDPQRSDHDPRAGAELPAGDGRDRSRRARPRDRRERDRTGREPAVRRPARPARGPGGSRRRCCRAHGSRADDLGVDPVENYLQQVEFQIEDVQGRIMYLQNRTSMSTITVALARGRQEAGASPARERLLEGRGAIAGRRRGRSSPASSSEPGWCSRSRSSS